jgi:hypothetical protein
VVEVVVLVLVVVVLAGGLGLVHDALTVAAAHTTAQQATSRPVDRRARCRQLRCGAVPVAFGDAMSMTITTQSDETVVDQVRTR